MAKKENEKVKDKEKRKEKPAEQQTIGQAIAQSVLTILIAIAWVLLSIVLIVTTLISLSVGVIFSFPLTVSITLFKHFRSTFRETVKGGQVVGKSQPALFSPFFRGPNIQKFILVDVFKEYGKTIKGFASQLRESTKQFKSLFFKGMKIFKGDFSYLKCTLQMFGPILKMGLFFSCIVVYAVFALFFAMVVFIIHTALLLVLSAFGLLLFSLLLLIDTIFCSVKQIATHCPHCQHKYGLAVYVCSKCGERHTRLKPGAYGIFSRKCKCGQKMPTSFLFGRQKLKGYCPYCDKEEKSMLHTSICIPVIGGTSSGKTCYINMVLGELERNAHVDYKLKFEYESSDNDAYLTNNQIMSKGQLPLKTSNMRLNYYRFYLSRPKSKVKNLVSLCDVAGETFASERDISGQLAFTNASAFMMIVDPLSIAVYRNELEAANLDPKQYGVSVKPLDEILGTLLSTVKSMLNLDNKDTFGTDLAVVFTKCDIPEIDKQIGKIAIRNHALANPKLNFYQCQNEVCIEFLKKYDESNFMNTLFFNFKHVQFFTCSALGHNEKGKIFRPFRILDPLLWLLDRSRKSFKLKGKLKKEI